MTISLPAAFNKLLLTAERSIALRKSADRERDPDVTVMKGLAEAALINPGEILKLAQVMAGAISTGQYPSSNSAVNIPSLFQQPERSSDMQPAVEKNKEAIPKQLTLWLII